MGGTTLEGTQVMDPPSRYPYPDAPPDKILLYRPSSFHRFTCQVCMKTKWGPKSNSAAYRHGAVHCKERGWEGQGLVITHTGPRPIGDELKEGHRKNRRRVNQAAHRQEKKQKTLAQAPAGAFQVSSSLVYICPCLLHSALSTAERCVYLTVVLRLWPVPSDAQVLDESNRVCPVTLVEMPEGGVPGTEHLSEAERAAVPNGYAYNVACSVLDKGNGAIVLTSLAEGSSIMSGVRSALTWCQLHRSSLAQVFAGRQAKVDLARTDLDFYMDFGISRTTKTGASVSEHVCV